MNTPGSAATRAEATSARLLLRAAGRCAIHEDAPIDLEPKDALLLAYLVVEGPTPRGRLATLLWPDVDEERARGNLRQRLLRLKRTTGVELVVGNPQAALAPGIGHDLDDAHELLHGIDPPQAGGMAEWLDAQRDRRRRSRIDWLDAATTQAETEGDLAAALEHANALVALDPLSEHAHRRVMKLHYLRGDIAAAIAAYEHCRQTLKREFNAAPSAETEAMRATLTASTTAKTAVALRRVPTAVLRPPRLVGRDAEWATLQAAWDAGEAAFVLGEAGLGKTRLLTDFARAAGGTLVVSARPGDERVVYAVTTRLLRQLPRDALANLDAGLRKELARLLPELGEAEPIRSEAERTRFFNAVAVALAAESGLVGVAVDDLHFADAASIELLQYLSAERSLRWLFAGRTAEVGAAAQGLLDAVRARAPAGVIELAPMTLAQLTELLTSLDLEGMNAAAMAPALLRHTGGNPLFVLETIKTWLNQGGEGDAQRLPAVAQVGTLIERRIGRLSADAVKLARCAAVAGQDFSAELAAKVLGVRPLDLVDAWAELEAAQVFRDGAFAHDLIYESALASVPPPIARQLHCEIAQFLAARDGEPVRIARHWQAGDQAASAVPWLLRAAAIAEARGALSEEIELREQAARIDAAAGNSQREFDNRNALVSRYERTTRLDDSARNIDRIAELARTPLEQGWVLSARANLANKRGDIAGSVEPGRQAFELARAHDSAELACDATNILVPALNFLGRFDEALTTVESARPYYERAGDDWRTQFLSIRATTLNNLQRRQEARSDLDAALTLARQQHNTAAQISLLTNTAISFRSSGLLAESIAAAEEAERVQQQVDANPRTGINVQLVLGVNLRDRGAYDQALTRLDRVLELADERTPMFRQPALNTLALLWLQLGQPARAQPLQQEALRYGQVAIWLVARAHLQLGLLRQRLGQPARDCFEQALRVAPPTGRPLTYMHASLCLAELDGGDAGYSRAIEIDRQALAGEFTGMRVVAQAALTRIALADRAPQRAALHAREAIGLLAQADPDETYRGDIWLAAYRALVAVGDPHADDVLNSAVTWITQVAQQAVPTEFRDGFLNRNPVNRDLLTMATRLR